MADSNAMADIRGIDIQKVAVGFAETLIKLKRFVKNASTSAREIRWYQKTSGFLGSPTTTGMTTTLVANTPKALPVSIEQSWTRQTSYVKHWFAESPWLTDSDIKDSDIDILAGNVHDITREVLHQEDLRIYQVLSNGNSGVGINTNATNAPWDTASFTNVDIIEDLLEAKMNIIQDGYDVSNAILLVNSYDHKQIITWLISNKGSSIPNFSSQKIETGVVMELLGLRVVVDENVTADYALVFVPDAATLKTFTPLTTAIIEDKGIGTKFRCWIDSECILQEPNAVNLITNTRT